MAASLVVSGRRSWRTPQLVLASEPFEPGDEGVDASLERLAAVRLGEDDPFALAVEQLNRHYGGGALTVVTGVLGDSELARVVRLGGRFGFVAILRFGATQSADQATAFARPRHGVLLADVPATADLPTLWTELVHRARTRPDAVTAPR
jgi:hypothetical protein